MNRRAILRTGAGLAGTVATAGCLSRLGFETQNRPTTPPVLEDPPDAVYVPTHVEGMEMAGMARDGPYRFALSYSYPHRFWLVTGRDRSLVEIGSDDGVHLMVSLWDDETGLVPPNSGLSMTITRGGEPIVEKPPWPMLSQNMGFHFGDNVALPRDGTYEVAVGVDPLGTRRSRGLQDRFDESASADLTFEFSGEALEEIPFTRSDDRAGEAGAVDPMQMEMLPLARQPSREALPGTVVGEGTSGDGQFLATRLESPPDGIDGDGPYLAVSPRTPYNRYPLPFMGLSAAIERDGETVFDGTLVATLDPELGHHYGAAVSGLESGDSVTLTVGAPPQVARHEGYETAFFDMPPIELTVPAR